MSLRPQPLGLSPARFPIPRLERLEDRTVPAVATWDGGGADNHWTTAANWVGDVAPQPGDDLVFPSGAAQLTNVNDFPAATAFHSLAVSGGGYQMSGNRIALAAGLSVETISLALSLPLTLTADQTFSEMVVESAGSLKLCRQAGTIRKMPLV